MEQQFSHNPFSAYLREKYNKALIRFEKGLESGRFASYSKQKKAQIWNRLNRYAKQLGIALRPGLITACLAAGLCFSSAASAQTFAAQTGAANPFNGVNIGGFSTPSFVDVDGDGDKDAFIGGYYGTILYYKNTGTMTAPVFAVQTGAANPFDGNDVGQYSAPTFVDIDGDGDKDAFSGEQYGAILYYKNIGTTTAPLFAAQAGASNPFNWVDVGYNSTPSFADIDGDWDQDAFIGLSDGTILYYKNTGTTTAPVFAAQTGASNPFNGVNVGFFSTPTFADIDGDGDQDAFIGEVYGTILYYKNTGTMTAPVFAVQTGAANPFDGKDVGQYSAPTFVDIDADGDIDAFIGESGGSIKYYKNMSPCTVPSITTAAASNSPICSGNTLTLSVVATGTAPLSYAWTGVGNFTGGTTATPSVLGAATGSYGVTVSNGCGSVMSSTAVTVNLSPTPTITALNTDYCKTSGLITLAASPSGGTFTVDGNAATSFDTDLLAVGAHTVIYNYTNAGCSGSATHNFNVVARPAAPVITSNAVSPQCLNSTVTLTAPAADKYAWYVNGTFLQWTNSPTNNLTVTAGTTAKDYTVYTYSAATNNCPSDLSNSISVIGSAPVAAITPSFAAPYCANNAPVLSGVPPTGSGYTYSWTCPTCSTTTNSPTMTPTAQFGDYYVTVTDASNGCSRTSPKLYVVLNAVPVANAGADLAACLNTATVLGGTNASPGFSYSWTPATNLSATNIAQPTVTATATGPRTYTLRVTRTSTGCFAEDQVVATGSPLPDAATLSASASSVCAPATITFTPSVGNSVFWYKNGVLMSTTPTAGAKVISSSAQPSDAYTIANFNGTCRSAQSAARSVTINTAPTPTISATPAVVFGGSYTVSICNQQTTGTAALVANVPSGSPTVSSYNWQQAISGINTTLSPAVTSSTYTASVAASPASQNNKSFRVQANYANGCSANSVNVLVKLLPAGCVRLNGNYEEEIAASFTAYPNPTTDKLTIALSNYPASEGELLLYNNLGQLVLKQSVSLTEGSAEESLDLSAIAVGMYNLVFQTQDGQEVQKIVKE